MEFKNEAVKDIYEAMEKHIAAFEARRCGPTYRNILIALSAVFTEDRPEIFARVSGKQTKIVKSGPGPKITRNKKGRTDTECEGCPSGNAIASSSHVGHLAATPSGKVGEFDSIDDILQRFDDSAGAIRAFAQLRGVEIPANVKKPATLAKYLFEGLNKNDEEE